MGPPTEETQSLTVDCLISPSSADSDREKIKAILPDLEQEILDIKLSKKGAIDTFVWLPTKTGIFSAKSGYYESIKINNSDAPLPPPATREFNWSEYIWHLKTSPKNKLLLRKAVRGALSSRENLRARSINIEGQCPFCGSEETSIHLFFTCPFAVQVWKAAPFKNQLPQGSIHSIRDFIEKAKILVCLPPSGVGHGPLFPWIFWAIWNTRNHKIFNSKPTSPEETLTRAIALGREWCEAQESETPPQPRLTQTSPTYAGSDMIICNVDAAWQKETKTAGCGWIFRNEAIRQHCIGSAPPYGSDHH
ncbi:PREDICTED: uncharacterized protein LOC104753903 [Camelina sativa]|uniref:Uncharacterized protein LOC104753903 n=1 Tax=Camelina sativa TaxID=90675 RepID=A0ABM0WPV6_CAMSA|nr:PREDICTED: uncharacterized protein LOC104753903 [Camelina sativa]